MTTRLERMRREWARVDTRRCSYFEDSGWRCRAVPAVGARYCLLHRPADTPRAEPDPAA